MLVGGLVGYGVYKMTKSQAQQVEQHSGVRLLLADRIWCTTVFSGGRSDPVEPALMGSTFQVPRACGALSRQWS